MGKLKTHKGVKWRIRVTGTGKLIHTKSGRRHLLTGKSSRRMRHLRKARQAGAVHKDTLRRLIPYS